MKKNRKTSNHFGLEEYINANRKVSRDIELERNGHWIAVDRPHKNKKKYDRKRDRRIDSDGLFDFDMYLLLCFNNFVHCIFTFFIFLNSITVSNIVGVRSFGFIIHRVEVVEFTALDFNKFSWVFTTS